MAYSKSSYKKETKKEYNEFKPYSCGEKVKACEIYQQRSKDGKWYLLRAHLTFTSGKTFEQTVAIGMKEFAGVEMAD